LFSPILSTSGCAYSHFWFTKQAATEQLTVQSLMLFAAHPGTGILNLHNSLASSDQWSQILMLLTPHPKDHPRPPPC
jgi:hypothetical protein